MNRSLSALLMVAAHDDMGMYPAATVINGVHKQRTEFEDGWNAAVMQMTTKWGKMIAWFNKLDSSRQAALQSLLERGVVDLVYDEPEEVEGTPTEGNTIDVTVCLNMNDTFAYACADAQEVPLHQLEEVSSMWTLFGSDGLNAWAAVQRGQEPIAPRLTANYQRARDWIKGPVASQRS